MTYGRESKIRSIEFKAVNVTVKVTAAKYIFDLLLFVLLPCGS